MKNKILLSCIWMFLSHSGFSQFILNPYKNFLYQAPSALRPQVINSSGKLVYDSYLSGFGNGYTGEYMIAMGEDHPVTHLGMALTYKIEVVSYPFTINCWNDPGICAYPVQPEFERNLVMPNEPYDNIKKAWGVSNNLKEVLFNVRENGRIVAGYAGYAWSGGDGIPETLVSKFFLSSTPNIQSYILPHTILKHTVYIHCNSSFTSPVIDSIIWVYDHTRGRMRYYPFKDSNQPGGNPKMYDVVFIPQIISKTLADHYYNETENASWYDGGTINYYPFDNQTGPSICPSNSTYFPSQNWEEFRFYDSGTNTYVNNYGYTAPYALQACFLRNGNGTTLAGYRILPGNNPDYIEIEAGMTGIRHNYCIDRSIDLSILNPDEKVIYNPSEVIIDPDAGNPSLNNPPIEIVFPSGYTFKTILGRYPSLQQVEDAKNDPQNGWVYLTDERLVPVPVNAADLPPAPGTTQFDYPEVMWDDPGTPVTDNFYHDERYGYYYLMDKSTIRVEPCVKIYDARFEVNQGATLIFEDYSQLLGYENRTINGVNNFGRIKIRGTGGAVLRNFADVQYVQNGIITQTTPLHYLAYQTIVAGDAGDPNSDQPQGIYEVQAGADVTFEAGDMIHLTNGFQVSGGNFSAYTNDNIPGQPACYTALRQLPSMPQDKKHTFIQDIQPIAIFPNPSSSGLFGIRFKHQPAGGELTVYNMTGMEVMRIKNITERQLTISLDGYARGIYLFRYYDRANNTYLTQKALYE
jgi:hypothetical protein